MPNFLIFQLYGPLSSWGDIAVGEYRPSHRCPSKSAIMGLVAAALGIERSEEEKHIRLNQCFKFGVCAHGGDLMRDYHTSQVPPVERSKRKYFTRREELLLSSKKGTILSQRDYYTDSFYKIALWVNDCNYFSLEQVKKAFERPRFVLYLGRKSCPLALPLNPNITSGISLKEALDKFNLYESIGKYLGTESQHYYWEDGLSENELGMTSQIVYSRRDRIESRKRWQFSYRDEHYFLKGKNE